jgi:hypothetical protein
MESITYKKWHIVYVYDCSEGYDEIDHYAIWTPDRLDLVVKMYKLEKNILVQFIIKM